MKQTVQWTEITLICCLCQSLIQICFPPTPLSLSLSPSLICSVCWSDGLIRAALTCEPSLCCHGTEGYSSNPTTLNTHNICGLHGDKKMWLHMLVDTVFSQPLATLWPHKACWCVRVCACVCGPSGVQRGCISSIFGLWYNQSQGGTAESKPAGSVPLWVSYRADVSSSSVCIWHLTCGSFSMDLLQKCRVNICTFR